MAIIAVDCDDILSETMDYALAYHHYQFNKKPLHRQDMSDYYLYNIPKYQASHTQTYDFFLPVMSPEHITQIAPVA